MDGILPDFLKQLIVNGESTTVEFTETKNKLPSSLFETVCSMLNRNGGHIFLGVKDDGEIIGVYKDYVKSIKKDFTNLCNNPEKVFPTVHLEIKEYVVDDKVILYIYVYSSSDVHKTNGKIFDRNEDGDYDITGNTSMISNMYIRKSSSYTENKIFPYATIDDLRLDLIDKVRKMAGNRISDHSWVNMNDIELLKSASLYERDIQTGLEGINLAGILLFGKDEVIKSAISYYKTDAIMRKNDIDRYDDRDDIRTNLIESYDRLMNFMMKHLDDRFYLEGVQRIDVRSKIAREIVVNMLIHREFSNPYPARVIITKDYIETENANIPRNIGYIDLNNYTPYPKNPKIAAVFKEIGLADELGSGIKKIVKYTKIYSNGIPEFKDGYIFKVKIPININHEEIKNNDDVKSRLVDFIKDNNGVSRQDINNYIYPLLGTNNLKELDNKTTNMVDYLQRNNTIKNIGTRKKSKWVVCEREK